MGLESIVFDARDPHRLGRFWAAAVGAELITDRPDLVEARLHLTDDFSLDLRFRRVAEPPDTPARLHLDLTGGQQQEEVVQRLLDLGAAPADIGQGDVPWTVLADPEGGAFCVAEDREVYLGTGPVAALPLACADPHYSVGFWARMTGWVPESGPTGLAVRHPSGAGPLLELYPETGPKRGRNRLHLDVRPDADDLDRFEAALRRGATALTAPGELPRRAYTDPSGNEFCVLPPRT